jgi:hypothetical protein
MVAVHRPTQAAAGLAVVLAGLPVQRWMAARPAGLAGERSR